MTNPLNMLPKNVFASIAKNEAIRTALKDNSAMIT